MNGVLYVLGRIIIACIQMMPIEWVAHFGRFGGRVVFWLDARHRKLALRNLTRTFHPAKTRREIRALALENFQRIGENFCCFIKSAGMKDPRLREILEVRRSQNGEADLPLALAENCIYATGHFGNFELFTRLALFVHGYQCCATYRGMRPAALERLVLDLRTKAAGCGLMFERRTGAEALKKTMSQGHVLLILFADQSTRENGLELPFLGRNCFTSRASAVMAARYHCDLFVPICYRTGLARWRIEIGEPISTHENGLRRSTEAITRDINAALEAAVRRDPANWFWVHNRWKTKRPATAKMTPAAACVNH